jgi:arsenate reductase
MLAIGLQGSPRKKGNCDILMSRLMAALAQRGVRTHVVDVPRNNIAPCMEMTVCEKKGLCPIDDAMGGEIYGLLRKADLVVAATPVFFYGVSAQLKALIDRCQALWARRYMLKLKDPGQPIRRGYLLSVGATGGKQLFDGIHLTAKYFFDGISAEYVGNLTYRRVEGRGQIEELPTLEADIERAAAESMGMLGRRRRVLFVCTDNAVASPMAAAFVRLLAGDRFDAISAGLQPAAHFDPSMVQVMAEIGIDMGFLATVALETAVGGHQPEKIIALGCQCPEIAGIQCWTWDLPGAKKGDINALGRLRDEIKQRVNSWIEIEQPAETFKQQF